MRTHELKCWPGPFEATARGEKTHEVRSNADRTFSVGDRLNLREWKPEQILHANPEIDGHYTGQEIWVEVTYVTRGGTFGLPATVDVLSVRRV